MYTYKPGCTFNTLSDIKDKKITVMGLGLNGGGEACVKFFLKHGAYVIATDMKTKEQLEPTIQSIQNDKTVDTTRLTYHLGCHLEEDFKNADCVIKNPGVKIEGNKYLALAKNIETDISIFLHFTKAPIIAVTGSKGKSSTVSALHFGLNKAGFESFLGGNITVSPLTFLEKTTEKTPVVLELSSWQLADLRGRKALKPKISIITKIVPDHQNWYNGMESYVNDKKLIYADQTSGDYSIFDMDEDEEGTGPCNGGTWGNLFASETNGTVLRYSKKELPKGVYGIFQTKDENSSFCAKALLYGMEKPEIILKNLIVLGEHMKTNAANAALVLYLMGVSAENCIKIMSEWPGLNHRLQFFYEYKNENGAKFLFYNDSCATVPEAAAAASQSFEKPVYLLTGGTDKGLSLTPLVETLSKKDAKTIPVKSLYLLDGSATEKMLPELNKNNVNYAGPFKSLNELLLSLKNELSLCPAGEFPVVFSPGATSFGMFKNEFDRGNTFIKSVKEIFKQA